MSSRYSACFSLTAPNIALRSTWEKPLIAFSGVRSSCDMFARNSDLWRLAASSSAGLLVELRQRSRQLPGALLHLLLEPGVGRRQARSHPVEFVGERRELVSAGDLDALVERS